MAQSLFTMPTRAGSYSCITVHSHFYSNFIQNCDILPRPQETFLGQISLSPWLNPVCVCVCARARVCVCVPPWSWLYYA